MLNWDYRGCWSQFQKAYRMKGGETSQTNPQSVARQPESYIHTHTHVHLDAI